MVWLLLVTLLWMVYGFWATVYVPSYLTSREHAPVESGYTLAACMQAANMCGQLAFAELADRKARESGNESFRRNLLAAGAALCILTFPLVSLAIERADGPLVAVACIAVAFIHSLYGANVTAFVFGHAGDASVRLSTLAIMWATGAVAFAGTSPFICEALRQAANGSPFAPAGYLSLCAAVSLASLCCAPSSLLTQPSDEDARDGSGGSEDEGPRIRVAAGAELVGRTSATRDRLPREFGAEESL